jgi:hypothetical protein
MTSQDWRSYVAMRADGYIEVAFRVASVADALALLQLYVSQVAISREEWPQFPDED